MDTTPSTPAVGPVAPKRTTPLRHLGLGAYWFGSFFVITPVYTLLLQAQVGEVVPQDSQGVAIGLATGIGGVFAMVLPPVIGAWSDGLRTRWGRRRPIMVAGTLGIAAALIVLYGAHSYPPILVGFVLTVAFVNVAGAAYVAVIPELVNTGETGRASGVLGFFVQLGSLASLAVTFAMSAVHQLRVTYWIIIVVVLLSLPPTLWAAAGDGDRAAPARERRTLRELVSPLWTSDFGWAFFTRFLNVAALYTTLPFLLLAFRDLLRVERPVEFTALFEALVTGSAVPLAMLCGWLCDRHGRKRFVYAAGGIQAAVLVVFLLGSAIPPSVVLVLGVVYGIGYGAFSAVDWALGIDTLPDRERPAKDLGLYHVADSLPRVLLPFVMGFVLDTANRAQPAGGYRVLFLLAAILYAAGAVLVTRIRSVR